MHGQQNIKILMLVFCDCVVFRVETLCGLLQSVSAVIFWLLCVFYLVGREVVVCVVFTRARLY